MKTIAAQLDAAFRQAIHAAFDGMDADPLVSSSQTDKFGDYQSNAAMGLAKILSEKTGQKTNPRAVAEQILSKLDLGGMTDSQPDKSWIAGPGFINVKLSALWLAERLGEVAKDERLGVEAVEKPQTVVIDYSGPNIAKQMHVGHLRSTIIGDAIARVLSFRSEDVIRQNHLGDWGTQFGRVVLAMWYIAVFEGAGRGAEWEALLERQQAAARAYGDEKNKAAADAAIDALVGEIAPFHQAFINSDADGTKYFEPYLSGGELDLERLEAAYVFVSAIVGAPSAARTMIDNPRHGARSLADLPKLVTSFIQNPNHPDRWNDQELQAWRKAREVTVSTCHELYRRLNVQLGDPGVQKQALERGESEYNGALPGIVSSLLEKGLAEKSEGATIVAVPGFEAPLIIEKGGKDGGYLYGTTDLAAVRYRVGELLATRVLYFVDARQSQHFAEVFWTARAAGWATDVALEHAAFGTMLGPDGKPFKTRSGDTVKLKDLLDEAEERAAAVVNQRPELAAAQRRAIAHAVGIGGVKYSDLSKDRTSDYTFSFDAMLSLEGNTAPYLLYAHARVRSIFRKAAAEGISYTNLSTTKIQLEAPHEIALAKQILKFGEAIEVVARELKPHHLCSYLYELAGRFSGFFEKCPVLKSEEPMRSSRLALADLTAKTLAKGLDLLGIEHPEQM